MEPQVTREATFDDPVFRTPAAYQPHHTSMHAVSDAHHDSHHEKRSPEKSVLAFRTISEVADDLAVPQHVLRFWESKFAQVKPLKRGGGRRYYRPEDVELLRRIKNYLYKQGYTIKGVQRLLKETRTMAAPSQSFVPYAHPQNLPGAPVPSYQMPSAVMQKATASLLQAAAAAPSVMAMAYGAVSNTLHAEGQKVREFAHKTQRFADAFEEITVTEAKPIELAAQESQPETQMERSLEAVTSIRDELVHAPQPLRVDTRSEVLQSLEQTSHEPQHEAVGEELVEETVEIVAAQEAGAAQAEAAANAEETVQAYDEAVGQDAFDDPLEDAIDEDAFVQEEPALSPFGQVQQQELKAILAELVSLREMLDEAVAA